MTSHEDLITDTELDALLSAASTPPVPLGAGSRMMLRIAAEAAGNVVPLHRPPAQHSRLGWLAGVPLAASLALGIYLGAAGSLSAFDPLSAITATASASDTDDGSGLDDALDFSEDSLT